MATKMKNPKLKPQGTRSHPDNHMEVGGKKVTEAQTPPPGYNEGTPPVEEELTNRKRFEHLMETRKTLEENVLRVAGALELLADIIRKEEGITDVKAETQTK